MKVYDSAEGLEGVEKGWAVTIGNFDGVHAGHRRLLEAAREAAREYGAPGVAAMTFEPHPLRLVRPEQAPGMLTPLELKKCLLEQAGADALVVVRDSLKLLSLSPEEFVDAFLMAHLRPRVVVEGPNFHFGYGRSGDVETLQRLGAARGFEVVVVPGRELRNLEGRSVMVSSSRIRTMLAAGNVAEAARALDRPYRLLGRVIAGRGIGRTLGFPTTNIEPGEQVVPAEGVYAGTVSLAEDLPGVCRDGEPLPAVFSIGRAKTFVSEHPLLVEAHVLDRRMGELYGKWLAMDFVEHIRGQRRFVSREELSEQIARDCSAAEQLLAARGRRVGPRPTS